MLRELPAKPSRVVSFHTITAKASAAKVRTGSAQGLLMLPAMIRQSLGKVWGSQITSPVTSCEWDHCGSAPACDLQSETSG